jgi:methyl-accepting chemotaxis protein
MKLQGKILSGFFILAAMLFIAGIWSIYQLASIGTSVQQLLDDNYRSINAAEIMTEALEREDSGVLLLLMGREEEGRKIIQAADFAFEKGFQIAKNNLTIPGEVDFVNRIEKKYPIYKEAWSSPISRTRREGDLNWYFTGIYQTFLDVKTSVNELKTLNEKVLYETASGLKDRANRAVMPGTVAIISALVFSFIFSYLVNHFMVKPILKITEGIQNFMKNRVPFKIEVETKDEIKDLASALSRLSDNLLQNEEKI